MQHISRISKTRSFYLNFRNYSSKFPPLLPLEEWKPNFPSILTLGRVTLKNPDTALRIAESFLPQTDSGEGKIVIEAFPGPGLLTRSLLSLPTSRIRKLIILEEEEMFLEHLTVLEKYDSRLKVIPLSGHSWSTYDTLEVEGLLNDLKSRDWYENELPDLHFIANIPHTVAGDQLIAQLFRCVPDKSWLFKYGRVSMSFLMDQYLWQRITALPGEKDRCKLSIIAEASTESSLSIPPTMLTPNYDHFYPSTRNPREIKNPRIARPIIAANTLPALFPAIDYGMLDKWDYVLRRLFVLKSTPLKKALSSLAPGATNLIKPISSVKNPPDQRVDPNKLIKKLSLKEWTVIVRAFDNWPFAPDDLAITDSFQKDFEKD